MCLCFTTLIDGKYTQYDARGDLINMTAPVFVDDDGDAFELVGIIGEGAFGFVHFARSRKGAWMRRRGGRWNDCFSRRKKIRWKWFRLLWTDGNVSTTDRPTQTIRTHGGGERI
jgi:hypothetical protein